MIRIPFIALLVSFSSFAQLQKEIPLTKDSDTTYWMQFRNNKYLPLIDDDFFFKLQNPCISIKISKNSGTVKGTVDYFVREVDEFKDSTGVFNRRFNFDSDIVLKILKHIDSLKINSIPSDKFISNWKNGFDGITYIFEYKDAKKHSFKNYWTPKAQGNLDEALRIQKFIDEVYKLIDAERLNIIFQNEIPFRSWTCNSTIISRVMTKEQFKEYKKNKRKLKRDKDR